MLQVPPTSEETLKKIKDFAPKLMELTDDVLFGDIWERPGLSKCDRSLITVATLVALYRINELPSHIVRAQQNGISKDELVELLKRGALHPPTAASSVMANLVYIDSLIDALLLLGEHPAAVGQAFNIVDQLVSFHDYIAELAKMVDVPAFAIPGVLLYGVAALLQFVGGLGGREAKINRDSASYYIKVRLAVRSFVRFLVGRLTSA